LAGGGGGALIVVGLEYRGREGEEFSLGEEEILERKKLLSREFPLDRELERSEEPLEPTDEESSPLSGVTNLEGF
jgi:hypothetical protein